MRASSPFHVEPLENRTLLSASCGWENLSDKPAKSRVGPAIRLDLVALHELGHSLGLDHENTSAVSIMDPYYNANYDLSKLDADVAAQQLRALYSSPDKGPWKDSADAKPGDGIVDVTYSFMYDGTRLDSRKTNDIFGTFDARFGAGRWEKVFADQLALWSKVSHGELAFHPYDGAQGLEPQDHALLSFNTSGKAQNDSRFGDIRIGSHRFDGAGKVLAHAYLPGYNNTAGGDLHVDSAENWIVPEGALAPVIAPSALGGGASVGASLDEFLA